ncbi:hypothetical protein [Streptomyces sp. Qhu_M48]|uniref:hypothetical protein n=1 Tax=Streptomyces sp. Qhu_M48 TaxID=3435889 RepID=UPI003F503950
MMLTVLLPHPPPHLLYVRWTHGATRRLGRDRRSALVTRTQQLSIGFHSRTSGCCLPRGRGARRRLRVGIGHAGRGRHAQRYLSTLTGAVTSLLDLVRGCHRPTPGRVLLDGQDMAGLDLRSFRGFVSVVPRESVHFEGSISENDTYTAWSTSTTRCRGSACARLKV